jgi:putative phosphoesterase
MKIGVISDTHLTESTPDLAELMNGPFKDVETILHAGDIIEFAVLDAFAGRKVLAVCGNMDSPAVRRQLPTHRVIQAEKFKIGLIHGWGGPRGIEERIAGEFEGVNCIVYGHTHAPAHMEREGVFFFNPGAFGSGWESGSKSVGVLNLTDTVSGRIFYL